MGQTGQCTETTSRKQEFVSKKISLEELCQKFQKKDINHKIYLVRESQYDQDEVFEIVGNLGTGRFCYGGFLFGLSPFCSFQEGMKAFLEKRTPTWQKVDKR